MKGFAVGFLNFLLAISIAVLGLTFMINTTILNPDFVTSELDKFDVSSLVKEQLGSMFTEQIPQELRPLAQDAINTTLDDLEPWLKEQTRNALVTTYDYIKGKSERLSIVIQTEPMIESFTENLLEEIQQSPPPELAGIPPAMLEQLLNQFIGSTLPSEIEITGNMLGPDIMSILTQVKQYVGYIQTAFKASLVASILFVLGIVLIIRQVKGITRKLGVTFTVYGAVWYGGIFAAKQFLAPQLSQLGFNLPTQLQSMIPKLLDDVVSPLQMFTLGFLIAGVVLLIISRLYKKREA